MGSIETIHASKSSDSDKQVTMNMEENQMAIMTTSPNHGGWKTLEKKEGKKEQLSAFTLSSQIL